MENINIFDNFLDTDEISKLEKYLKENDWLYGHKSGDKEEKLENVFFVSYYNKRYFTNIILSKLAKLLNLTFNINRTYFHIQTFGLDGSYHIDDIYEDTYTFCLYISTASNEDIENHGGEFLIKLPDTKHIVSIDTLMNRGIFFPSYYLHKGMAYDRLLDDYRICLTWKLRIV
jgi:hypothetical protein